MKNFTRDDLLFSLCGLNCGLCPMKLNKYCPLAWEWAKGVTAPIIGATKASHFDDAAGAFSVKLTAEDIAFLEEPYVPHKVVGAIDHNPADGVKLLDVKK